MEPGGKSSPTREMARSRLLPAPSRPAGAAGGPKQDPPHDSAKGLRSARKPRFSAAQKTGSFQAARSEPSFVIKVEASRKWPEASPETGNKMMGGDIGQRRGSNTPRGR